MDFAKFNDLYDDKPITVPIRDPNGRPIIGSDKKLVTFDLYPPESPHMVEVFKDIQAKRRSMADDGELKESDAKALDDYGLSALVAGWSNNWTYEGRPLECISANVVMLLNSKGGRLFRSALQDWLRSSGKAWSALLALQSAMGGGGVGSTENTNKPASLDAKSSA